MTVVDVKPIKAKPAQPLPIRKTTAPLQAPAAAEPIPGVDFFGRGFNIINFDPLSPGSIHGISQNPIFDMKINQATHDGKYLIPEHSSYTPNPKLSWNAQSTSLESGYDFSNKYSQSISAKGGYGPVSFSGSASYAQINKQTHDNASVIEFASAVVTLWNLSWNQPQLSEAFRQAVLALPSEYNQSAYFAFIDTFGTHFPSSMMFGGLGYQEYRLTRQALTELQNENVNVSVAAEVGLSLSASVGGETKREREEFEKLSEKSESTVLLWVGGKPIKAFEDWVQTVPSNPVPVEIELSEISDLLTEDNFPNANIEVIRENLIKAFEPYMIARGSGYVRYSSDTKSPEGAVNLIGTASPVKYLTTSGGSMYIYLESPDSTSHLEPIWHVCSELNITANAEKDGTVVRTGDVVYLNSYKPSEAWSAALGATNISGVNTPVATISANYAWKIIDPLDPNSTGKPVIRGKKYVLKNETFGLCLGFYDYPWPGHPGNYYTPVADTVSDPKTRFRFI